jgi:glycosyltransferase involved in cell wall biosynthesis
MRYGPRRVWLENEALKGLVITPRPPESATIYPLFFNALHLPFLGPLTGIWPAKRQLLDAYVSCLRDVRRHMFTRFLDALQNAAAIVNLPHLVKTYAGRVVEGMAAGRPVISWEIPDRPRNRELFEHGKEILLYSKDDPEQLAEHIKRVVADEDYARCVAEAARRKMLARHTSEIRVVQILNWIESGQEPQHG